MSKRNEVKVISGDEQNRVMLVDGDCVFGTSTHRQRRRNGLITIQHDHGIRVTTENLRALSRLSDEVHMKIAADELLIGSDFEDAIALLDYWKMWKSGLELGIRN